MNRKEVLKNQELTWSLANLTTCKEALHISFSYLLNDAVDERLLIGSITNTVKHHPGLQLAFTYEEGHVVAMQKQNPADFRFQSIQIAEDYSDELAQNELDNIVNSPLDASSEKLMSVALVSFKNGKYLLSFTFHSLLLDKNAAREVIKQIGEEYTSLHTTGTSGYAAPDAAYAREVEMLTAFQQSDECRQLLANWQQHFPNPNEKLNLPTDYTENISFDLSGSTLQTELNGALPSLGEDKNLVYFAAFAILMHRLSGQDELQIGYPVSLLDTPGPIGNFENMLPVKFNFSGSPSLPDVIEQIKNNLLFTGKQGAVPYPLLIENAPVKRDHAIHPFYQVSFCYSAVKEVHFNGIPLLPVAHPKNGAKLDLSFELVDGADGVTLQAEYNTNVYAPQTIQRWVDMYQTILQEVGKNLECPSDELELLIPEDLAFLSAQNDTACKFEDSVCIHQKLEYWASTAPHQTALYWKDEKISYQQLNEKANQIAAYLNKHFTVKDSIVAVCMDRSPEMMAGIFAILKCGGCYMPIDPASPADRTKAIVDDSNPVAILTHKTYGTHFPEITAKVVDLDALSHEVEKHHKTNPGLTLGSDTSAYIIYTSGSTGTPKGVIIKHQSVLNRIGWMQKKYPLTEKDILIQKTPITFDVSVWELFWWSFEGAALVVLEPGFEKEPSRLTQAIEQHKVTTIHFVPSMFNAFNTYIDAFEQTEGIRSLNRIFLSGEALPADAVNQFYSLVKGTGNAQMINLYGPTEATVDVSYYDCDPGKQHSKIFIGKPIDNTQLWVVNRKNKIQPVGVQGELVIAGVNLAKGYLNRDDLNREKFVEIDLNGKPTRVYRTGDIAAWDKVGEIDYLGRMDNQVKIRGFRIELGEIEARLSEHPTVESCAVIVNRDNPENPILEAYIKPVSMGKVADKKAWVDFLTQRLPAYMIPTRFIHLEVIPMTSSGKLDRKALAAHAEKELSTNQTVKGDIESILLTIWQEVLKKEQIDTSDNFFDIGGNSIMIPYIQSRLQKEHKLTVETVDVFQYPSIEALASFLNKKYGIKQAATADRQQKQSRKTDGDKTDHLIAIVGMAGKFPEADTIEEFWKNLCDNKESLRFFSDEQLRKSDVTFEQHKDNPNYIRSRGILNNIEDWDAKFFGYSPNDARHTDPQQRLWFETVWNALEDAGIDPFTHLGDIGVFAGVNLNSYLFDNILRNRALYEDYMHFSNAETFHTYVNNDAAFIATRTAYLFNLRGPAINVQTACSTSLTAVAQACSSLVSGDSDVAIAGAASVQTPQEIGYVYQTGSMRSADGHCRPFDKNASGTVFSNAIGAVVLKRLDDAIEDNDEIYGVIRGWALNNDGNDKIGFAAPSVNGQVELLRKAQKHANVHPDEIGYIEAHGTGTIMGDPIEASALIQAFRENTTQKQYCGLGSSKGNFGHTDEVAGMVGLIKATLATYHKVIPATINYSSPNPNIDFANSPFYVTDKNIEWNTDKPLIIGVSSFGVGGTNAHVIVEDYKKTAQPEKPLQSMPQLLTVSGKSDRALQQNIENVVNYITENEHINPEDVAYTLQLRRSHFQKKAFVTLTDGKSLEVKHFKSGSHTNQSKKKIFLFPGQGAQFVNMGKDLYDKSVLFRSYLDKGFEIYHNQTGKDLKSLIFSDLSDEESQLHHTEYTQPALFIVSYAMAKLYESFGITPDESMGHSIGEYAAACLSGVFNFETALKIVIKRGQLMQSVPNGSMMAVRTDADTLYTLRSSDFEIAAINAPLSCTICFKDSNLKKVSKVLEKNRIEYILLNTSHAFHSSQFDIILDEFEGYVNTFTLEQPHTPFISCPTGEYAIGADVTTGRYWANQLRKTVYFNAGIDTVLDKKEGVFIEVGPNTHLSSLTRQNGKVNAKTRIVHSMGRLPGGNTYETFLDSLGEIWLSGIEPDFKEFYKNSQPKLVKLPHYAFDKARYWIDIDHQKLGNIIDTPFNMEDVVIKPQEPEINQTVTQTKSKELTMTQQRLIAIWNKSLGTTEIDIEDSFFVVGGHSLLAVSLVDSIQKEFGVKIVLKDFFENPTILHLENLIKIDQPEIEAKSKEKKGLFQKIRSSTNKKLIKGEI